MEADLDKEVESSDFEEANELTSTSGNEFPFLSRDLPTPAAAPSMKRSNTFNTFSTFTRHSLLPITKTEVDAGTLAAGAGTRSFSVISLTALRLLSLSCGTARPLPAGELPL